MTWEGRSCNGKHSEGSSVGVMFYGEKGSILMNGGNDYTIFDLKNKIVKSVKSSMNIDPMNTVNPAQNLDVLHIRNMFNAIKNGEELNADIVSGHKSTLLMQLGNIAQRTGRSLNINPKNGHIIKDREANKLWKRSYEKGWEMNL